MKKIIKIQRNRGMTYVELIVVLAIFSIMASIVIFNYGDFQAKVDIKNLASDIALKVVEAQKSSISGILPIQAPTVSPWRPSYGLYFDIASDNKSFIYFADLNNNSEFNGADCSGECVSKFSITKGNTISSIDRYVGSSPTALTGPLSVTFKRPSAGAIFFTLGSLLTGIDYAQITISTPKAVTSKIQIYPSGRIQVN